MTLADEVAEAHAELARLTQVEAAVKVEARRMEREAFTDRWNAQGRLNRALKAMQDGGGTEP